MKEIKFLGLLCVLWVGCQMMSGAPETIESSEHSELAANVVEPEVIRDLFEEASDEERMRHRLGDW